MTPAAHVYIAVAVAFVLLWIGLRIMLADALYFIKKGLKLMSEALDQLTEQVAALEAQAAENKTVLQELKALADAAANDDGDALVALRDRVAAVTADMKSTDDSVDPTPGTGDGGGADTGV